MLVGKFFSGLSPLQWTNAIPAEQEASRNRIVARSSYSELVCPVAETVTARGRGAAIPAEGWQAAPGTKVRARAVNRHIKEPRVSQLTMVSPMQPGSDRRGSQLPGVVGTSARL